MYIRFVHGLGLRRTEDVKTNVLISPASESHTAYAPNFCACTQCAFEGFINYDPDPLLVTSALQAVVKRVVVSTSLFA